MTTKKSIDGVYLEGGVPRYVLCWHIHHNTLMEFTSKSMAERARFIEVHKSKKEVQVRLERMKPVWGELPVSVVKAGRRFVKANRLAKKTCSSRAYDLVDEAHDAWDKAVKRCWKSIEKLHAEECPGCPWDGETLFP